MPSPIPAEPAASGEIDLLLVEDYDEAARLTQMLLQTMGFSVRRARDAHEALDAVKQRVPEVILCDIGLPDMSGHELAMHLREQPGLAATRLVAISGYGRPEDVQQSRDAGFSAHLVKPVDTNTLCEALTV